eukprot:CAMPEP_0197622688 /NCGR_PEP_ID=MMETSP1338-20131121/2885_1 /TAXON_ID=43686 ORGANISM="Pelagodinium beii, Strain RCC1491" /NCGR_SAMPLE_ID=MMETSP1338 /ASSEMBLY_ACC=CAM_ASM_000754 /LENGTH=202 /DNA_ID=CAMNT_0043192435 /DNA_START=35 /DNA_END=644 /DNA_ORIENTATION=+
MSKPADGIDQTGHRWVSLLSLMLSAVVLVWQANVISRYAYELPQSLWTGDAAYYLNEPCSELFGIMHWTVLLFGASILLELVFSPCIALCALADVLVQLAKLGACGWGFFKLYMVMYPDAYQCQDMVICAQYTYIGFFVFAGKYAASGFTTFYVAAAAAQGKEAAVEGARNTYLTRRRPSWRKPETCGPVAIPRESRRGNGE